MNALHAPAVVICRTFDVHRNVTVWAMVETWSDGRTKVTTVGSDTMDPHLADYILERIYDVAYHLGEDADAADMV